MNCTQCGSPLDDGARFCSDCGASLPAAAPVAAVSYSGAAVAPAPTVAVPQRATKNCPYCAQEILEAALRCKHCGADLVPAAPQVPAFRAQQPGITLNAPQMPSAVPGQPSIVIQNVQAQQAPAFAGGNIKNPGVALLLSLIFPGGGQFYNGHAGKGLIVLFTFWLVIPYIWSLFDAYSCAKRINRVGF